MKNKLYIIALALLAAIILFIPVEIPYSIDTYGKILPSSEWVISHTADGRFQSKLIDNRTGLMGSVFETQFERGDATEFKLADGINSGVLVSRNQAVAKISSDYINRELISLKGELAQSRASLELFLSGEKDEIIKQTLSELSYAVKQAKEENKIYERQKALFDRDLISEEDYEIFKGKKELADINVSTLRAKLDIVKTGAKKEQIDLIRTTIGSLEDKIKANEELLQKYIFKSPIDGLVTTPFSKDTILIVADNSEFVLCMPIQLALQKKIDRDQEVTFKIPGTSQKKSAKISGLSNTSSLINGQYMVVAYAEFNKEFEGVLNGIAVECNIDCGSMSLLDYLSNFLISIIG